MIETTAELVGCPVCGVVGGRPRSDGGRVPRSGRLRPAGAPFAGPSGASAARSRLPGAHLDRGVGRVLGAVPADQPRRRRVLSPGRRNARPVSQMAAELGVCWDTVMAAVREHGEPAGGGPGARRRGHRARRRRDHLLVGHQGPPDALCHRPGRPPGQGRDRRHAGQQRRRTWAPGSIFSPRAGSAGSAWWPPTWPSPTARASTAASITPSGSPTPSTSCGSPTAAWTRSAAGSRTRPSATGAESAIRSIGSAS